MSEFVTILLVFTILAPIAAFVFGLNVKITRVKSDSDELIESKKVVSKLLIKNTGLDAENSVLKMRLHEAINTPCPKCFRDNLKNQDQNGE